MKAILVTTLLLGATPDERARALRRRGALVVALALAAGLAGCAGNGTQSSSTLAGDITITGSSTVYPVGQAWAETFQAEHPNVKIAYNVVGTGGGFQVFCRGEAPMTGASRPIKDSEKAACANASIEPYEVQIAIDALAVVVSTKNTFAQDITVDELNRIWTADASKQASSWNELRPEWPAQKILLYGPGTDSGTFDYWVESIITPFDGKDTKGRSNYTPSEDDNVLVNGIHASEYALGYFGLAYVHENADKVRALKVDGGKGDGPVEPTEANVHAGKYKPLARPIFYYTAGKPTGVVQSFLQYGLGEDGQALVTEVGYITMPPETLASSRAKVAS